MSRSVHGNRSWRVFEQRGFHDWADIEAKRRIKRAVQETRGRQKVDVAPSEGLSAPEVTVSSNGAHIFFPISANDVLAILESLPVGVINGLRSIHLEPGTAYVNDHAPSSHTPDPFVGRKGEEVYSGIYAPSIRGTYSPDTSDIRLFAYVRAPGAELSVEQHQELRYAMLRTLVHEVAHHVDRTSRVAQGRWRMDNVERAEQYADEMAMHWCVEVVVPYLSDRYGLQSHGAV